ncbi:MAG: stage II sporulation protein D [Bacilli bacterium]|nr:stage II sporulation protein D [Bacilli bacterium]
MRTKIILVVIFLEVFIYVIINPNAKEKLKHVINIKNETSINSIKLENYVIGVVAAEMPATFSYESLKAQAVASRTFIYEKIKNGNISYDNLIYDKGQAYITKEEMKNKWNDDFDENYNIIKNAVNSTKGEIITYQNEPIKAYYFSSSNGFTEDASRVFGEQNYLVSVDTSWDKESNEYYKEKIISVDEFKKIFNIDKEINISNIVRSKTDHVEKIRINENEYTGVEVRKLLNLRSTDFEISINENEVLLTTKGYGHGVGMSQYGANYLGKNGKTYEEIIKYFYQGVDIKKIFV